MTLMELADFLDLDLIIRRYANQKGRFTAQLEHVEVKDTKESIMLGSGYGNGISPEEAIEDYVENIKGKWFIVDAIKLTRKEYKVPDDLTPGRVSTG